MTCVRVLVTGVPGVVVITKKGLRRMKNLESVRDGNAGGSDEDESKGNKWIGIDCTNSLC